MKITIAIDLSPGCLPAKRIKIIDTEPKEPSIKRAKIADIAPPPIPPEPAQDTPPITRAGAGPQFDPGFLAIVRDIKEPFTRRALAVASGLEVGLVTLRMNRLHKKGWIDQPSAGLWQRTKNFGVKP